MKVLNGVLKDSRDHYRRVKKEIIKRLKNLPKGSIKKRKINNRIYYYLQHRLGAKVLHKYVGKTRPRVLFDLLKERKKLENQLKKVKDSIKLLAKTSK